MHTNYKLLFLGFLVSALLWSCNTTPKHDVENIDVSFENKNSENFQMLDEAKFQINEFVKNTYIEMSLLTGTNIVYDLPKYFGDAGSLYDEYTLPTIEKLYVSGLVGQDFQINEQGVAVVKVFAYYPQNIQNLERGSRFDCFVISTGNASNIARGKIFRTGLNDSRYPSEDYYAVVEGSLEDLQSIEEHEELSDVVPSELVNKFKVSNRSYNDGTVHMPRVYYWKDGVKLIKKPPHSRSVEPVIRFRLNTENEEIIDAIKQSVCEVLPYVPNEIKTSRKDSGTDLLINMPIGYQIEPYSFSEQLKQQIFTLKNVRKSYVIYNKESNDISFLGRIPRIIKKFESKMIIQEGANSAPYVVIPKNLNNTSASTTAFMELENTVSEKNIITELTVMVDEHKTRNYIIKGNSCDKVIRVLNEKLGYGVLEILNFFKQAITKDAIDVELVERAMYFVYNQDKTAKFFPKNNLIGFGNTILDVKLSFKEIEDDEKTEKNEAETRIDIEIPTKKSDEIMELAVSLPSIDNSVFYVIDKDGVRKRFRIMISDSEFNKISNAKIELIWESEESTAEHYYALFNEIAKLSRLIARIEMQVGKLKDNSTQSQSFSPNENNARTIRISKYFVQQAIKKLEKENLSDLDKDLLYETHRNNILDKTNFVPQVPFRIYSMIKEEKYGLKDYPFFEDYLITIDLDESEWKEVFDKRLEYLKQSLESSELNAKNKKTALIREIEAHRKIPFFDNYVQTLKDRFMKYLK